MLPDGVLSIEIRADFWQPKKNDRKAELIKYWHHLAVHDTMNIRTQPVESKICDQPCHGHFRAMAKGQNFIVLLLLHLLPLRHTFYFHSISHELLQNEIFSTRQKLEPFRPTDVPFGGHKTEPIRLGRISAATSLFGCSRATQ